jgi:hypothetical protein
MVRSGIRGESFPRLGIFELGWNFQDNFEKWGIIAQKRVFIRPTYKHLETSMQSRDECSKFSWYRNPLSKSHISLVQIHQDESTTSRSQAFYVGWMDDILSILIWDNSLSLSTILGNFAWAFTTIHPL